MQLSLDRIPPSYQRLEITKIYAFGSMIRGAKKLVGDADLVVVCNARIATDFLRRLEFFLHGGQSELARQTLQQLVDSYRKLREEAWASRSGGSEWVWPPLANCILKEPLCSTLRKLDLEPEWVARFTWNELFDWNRFGYVDASPLTSKNFMKRVLFGKKRGFQVAQVANSLHEAKEKLVTKVFLLAWSKQHPNVAENLKINPRRQSWILQISFEEMWLQLQTARAKNSIMRELCKYRLSELKSDEGIVKGEIDDLPPQRVLKRLQDVGGISKNEITRFLKQVPFQIERSSISPLASLQILTPPIQISGQDVDELRTQLQKATRFFEALARINNSLQALTMNRWRPNNLMNHLLEAVTTDIMTKTSTSELLRELDVI